MNSVILKRGEGRTLNQGGLWVYDNEIAEVNGSPENGEIVEVHAANGFLLGKGCYNAASRIRVRLYTRKDEEIDEAFFERRLRTAWEYRRKVIDTSCCRIVFGDADLLPGLTIDRFQDLLVLQALSIGIDQRKKMIAETMCRILKEDGIVIRGVYERSDARSRELEGLEKVAAPLLGDFEPETVITENGLKIKVDVANGQKTGYFLDQKLNRAAIRPFAKDKRVLDCFCNLGGFALNAAAAGAKEVLGVDASQLAVDAASANAARNGLDNVRFETADVFELLPELLEKGECYDLVVLDPPAFTKSRSSLKNALKGYRRINRDGLSLVRDGGFLATCSCSEFLSEEDFRKVITLAAHDAHKRITQVEFRTQAPDHPIVWGSNTSYYLKFALLYVQDE
ncbi:MAG: class I SAM-dependent rRNA methyltransferase [Erysipelotrichaceae bacterium]|nr:class I SAM-dependent rRNA methyltransferase [Erysipelotrichaceae bacterium]